MVAGIAIDDWKLTIFKKHLDAAGYSYTEHPGVTSDTLLLKVSVDSPENLKPIIQRAQDECSKWKKQKRLH